MKKGKMKKYIFGGILMLILVVGSALIINSYVENESLPLVEARSSSDPNTVNINEVIDESDFNIELCNSSGNPEVFYNIGPTYDLGVSQESAQYQYADNYEFLLSYKESPVAMAGRVLGVEIAQADDDDPCDCFINGEPPLQCPGNGCVVTWSEPEISSTDLSGLTGFSIGIDPFISCTEIYIWVYLDADKTNSLGWLDCGNEGFTLVTNQDPNIPAAWNGTCDLTPLANYEEVWFQPRAQGCYWPIYLTEPPNINPDNDESNPLFGPFIFPGPTNIPGCDEDWECGDWDDCDPVTGYQSRDCWDNNSCVTIAERPALLQTCGIPQGNLNINQSANVNININTESDGVPDGEEDTEEVAPSITITIPKEGEVIFGSVTLTAKIEGTIAILDYYWDKVGGSSLTDTNILIGRGIPLLNNPLIWERTWNTDETPDAEYYVYARAETVSGNKYISNRVLVEVDQSKSEDIEDQPSASENPTEQTDTDNEGVPDILEKEIGTNINNPDTDNDSISDFDELISDSNPLGEGSIDALISKGIITREKANEIKNTLERIVFDEPKISGSPKPEKLKIIKVTNVSERIGANKVIFSGIGPPSTYLNLFIYSTPIVVTTKTDANGNFIYSLDKHLVDGKHEVYVTITDSTGKVKEKSSAFSFFIRKAEAISEDEYFRADVNVRSDTAASVNSYLWVALGLVGGAIIMLVVTYAVGKRKQK